MGRWLLRRRIRVMVSEAVSPWFDGSVTLLMQLVGCRLSCG